MFEKGKDIIIGGQTFNYNLFEYLLNRFKEAFSHTSLTIEQAFSELDDCDFYLENTKDENAYNYYLLLSEDKKNEIIVS